MFQRRNEPELDGTPGLQQNLRDALTERGGQVLIYGDTGVGKTSLLKYAAEDEDMHFVSVECMTGMDTDQLVENALRQLVDVREMKRGRSRSIEAEASGEGKLPWIAKMTASIKGDLSNSSEWEVLEKPAIDVLIDAMARTGKQLLVFDNFQNIQDADTRLAVAQLLELLSDRAGRDDAPQVSCVVIGIATDAQGLLGASRSFARRTTEVGVPRMPTDEIREILVQGFNFLSIQIPASILNQLVHHSDGFPYFAHLMGLYIAREARRAGSSLVEPAMVASALTRASKSVSAQFASRCKAAFEAAGDTQPRKNVMLLLADSDKQEWSSVDIQNLWEAKFGARANYTFLYVALGELITADHGQMLTRTGARRQYEYRLEDPHLRPYLRMQYL